MNVDYSKAFKKSVKRLSGKKTQTELKRIDE